MPRGRRRSVDEPWLTPEQAANIALLRDHAPEVPASMEHDLVAGRLEKTCPACGRREAASFYCTRCYRPMSPVEWYRREDPARAANAARGRAAQRRRQGAFADTGAAIGVAAASTATPALRPA